MAKTDEHAPATNDAYTGMLSISLLALIGGCVLLYLDFSQYPDKPPPALPARPPAQKIDGPLAPPEPKPPVEKQPPDVKPPDAKDPEAKEK